MTYFLQCGCDGFIVLDVPEDVFNDPDAFPKSVQVGINESEGF